MTFPPQLIRAGTMKKAPQPNTLRNPAVLKQQAALARRVLRTEAQAIERIRIAPGFHQAVDLILTTTKARGSVVVSGLGKSGLIGRKISATLASLGTPSNFLHPVEAMHGDLGRVRRGDAVLLLSFGGNTDEVLALAAILRQDHVPVIAMTGHPHSALGRLATVTLSIGAIAEACPYNLAPTASTTAMLALGDALALCTSARRSFGVEHFRKTHPGGGLGRQLLPLRDVIRLKAGRNLPLVRRALTVAQALQQAEGYATGGRRVGALLIVDAQGKLAGIFTDGDLRRLVLNRGAQALGMKIDEVMARHPRQLTDTALVRDAVQIAREFRFDEIPVVDRAGKPVGLIDVQDLVALKVIEEE
jgi:arabinose-5-phosphate isomerase